MSLLVEQETHWLLKLPDNELWAAMQERIRASLDAVTGFAPLEEIYNQFLDYEYEKADVLFDEELTELFLKISYHLARDIIMEAADSIIEEVSRGMVSIVKECSGKLDLDIINVRSRWCCLNWIDHLITAIAHAMWTILICR
jgi:hypothetical protein